MECPLCIIWARMPYAKRWSTPTNVHDTEGALIIGFWLGTLHNHSSLCGKHALLISHLNNNPSLLQSAATTASAHHELTQHLRHPQPIAGPHRVTKHTFVTLPDPPPPGAIYICSHVEQENGVCGKGARYEASADYEINGRTSVVKRLLCAEHAIALAGNESQPEPMEFKLGLKPLTNENTVTDPPPSPVEIPFPGVDLRPGQPDANADYNQRQVQSAIESALQSSPTVSAQLTRGPQAVDPRELARQAALMPATEGRRMETFTPDEPDEESTKH